MGETVILFKTTDAVAVHVHAQACPLVAAARKSHGLIRVVPNDDDTRDDFTARGWKIKHCKCSKEQKA